MTHILTSKVLIISRGHPIFSGLRIVYIDINVYICK